MISRRLLMGGLIAGLLLCSSAVPAQEESTTPDARLLHMVLVPAGEFRMGSQDGDRAAEGDEKPQRVIYLPDFYIDKFEVTNIEYKRFLDDTGYRPPEKWKDGLYPEGADFYPIAEISWWEAMAYARWAGKRLPTEAEWEKAARGDDARRFPWGDEFHEDNANVLKNYEVVASYFEGESPYGAVNMAGNVAEWTATAYGPYPKVELVLSDAFGGTAPDGATAADPASPFRQLEDKELERAQTHVDDDDPLLHFFTAEELADGRDRVYRGGSINNYSQYLRCANRQKANPNSRWYNIGFRCVMDPPQTTSD